MKTTTLSNVNFHVLLNVRDWHAERIIRYLSGALRKGEGFGDVSRSKHIISVITDQIGDGYEPPKLSSGNMRGLGNGASQFRDAVASWAAR